MAKISNTKSPKKSSFISNLTKSTRSVLGDTAKDLMPNLSSAIKSNVRFTKTTYTTIQDKFKEKDIRDNYLFKSGNNIIKNAVSDLKSGNINNKAREKKNSDDIFGKLLDIDFDDMDSLNNLGDAFNLDDEDSSSNNENNINVNQFNISLDDDTKTDLKTLANFSQATTKINNRGFAMMTTQLRAISAFQNQNTIKFYEMVEEKLNSLDKHLGISSAYYKDMVENSKNKGPKGANSRSLENAYGMKGFKLEEWFDIYKKNFEDAMGMANMAGSFILKPMITNFVNNPLGSISKMMVKSLIPKGVKSSLNDLDKTIGMLPILLQSKIPYLKEKGGLSSFFANILDLNKNRSKTKDNTFVKGPVAFDGVTKRAITHVIPGYLKRILFAITGDEKDRLSYDMDRGKFIRDSDVKKKYRDKIEGSSRNSIDGSIDRLQELYIKQLKSKNVKDKDIKKYVSNLTKKLSNLSNSGKLITSKDLKISDIADDKFSGTILMNILNNLDTKTANQTNQAMADAYVAYQQAIRERGSEDLWHSVFDLGGYSPKKKSSSISLDSNSFEEKYNKTLKNKDKILKEKIFKHIKNEKIRNGLNWWFDTNDNGKNSTIENFSNKLLYSHFNSVNIEDDGSLDPKNIKKRQKNLKKGKSQNSQPSIINELQKSNSINILGALGIDPNSSIGKRVFKSINDPNTSQNSIESMINRMITGGAKGISTLNSGLFQYATLTKEGLALKVKVVGGTIETTEGVSEEKNVEKNEEIRNNIKDRKDKRSKRERKKENEKNSKSNVKKNKKKKPLHNKHDKDKIISEDVKPEDFKGKAKNLADEIFNDFTGENLNKDGLFNLGKEFINDKLDRLPFGDKIKKYGIKGGKAFKATKLGDKVLGEDGLTSKGQKLAFKVYGKGKKIAKGAYSTLFNKENGAATAALGGAVTLGSALFNKGSDKGGKLFKKGNVIFNDGKRISKAFINKSGINFDLLSKGSSDIIKGVGSGAGNFMGNLGKVIGGEMSMKDGAKSLWRGTKGTIKSSKDLAFGGIRRVYTGIKRTDEEKAEAKVRKAERKKAKTEAKLKKEEEKNKTEVNVDTTPIENAMNDMTSKLDENLEKLTETVDDRLSDISDTMEDSVEASTISNLSSNDEGGSIVSDLISNSSVGKNKKIGKIFGKVKKLASKSKTVSKLAGFASKGVGLATKGASIAGSLLSGGANIAAGLASGGGALMAGLGTALSAAAPVLLPAAGIAAGAYGIKKLFDWRKKKKQEKELKKQQEELNNEDYSEDNEGKEKKSFGQKLINATGLGLVGKGFNYLFGKRKDVKKDSNGNIIRDIDGNPIMEEKRSRMGSFFGNIFGKSDKEIQLENETEVLRRQTMKNSDSSIQNANINNINDVNTENSETEGTKKKGLFGKVRALSKSAFLMSPIGMFYSMTKEDHLNEAKLGEHSTDPNTQTATFLRPLFDFLKSSPFKNVFGGGGLLNSMFKGLKKAAGGTLSKLSSFFESFWNKTSGKSDSSSSNGSVSTSGGGGSFSLGGGTLADIGWALVGGSETSNSDPGMIANDPNDIYGGKSYGAYQFSSLQGSLGSFVDWLGTKTDDAFAQKAYNALKPVMGDPKQAGWNSPEFDAAWKALAAEDPDKFRELQKERMHLDTYVPAIGQIKKVNPNFDPSKYSVALNSLIMSTATQFGPYDEIWGSIFGGQYNINDEKELIKAFRDVRKSFYPRTSSRYDREYEDAMKLYEQYGDIPFGDGSTVVGGGSGSVSGAAAKAVATAKSMVDAGYPYRLEGGACDPSYGAFDCSGLMQYSYKTAGINIPRVTYDQVKVGTAVPISGQYGVGNALPGDLLFCRPGSQGPEHVMMYAGNGIVHEAASSSTGLVTRPVANTSFASQPVAIRRIVSGGLGQSEYGSDYGKPTSRLINEYRKYDNRSSSGIKAKKGQTISLPSSAKGLKQSSENNYSANNNYFMDVERNNYMSKMIDKIETISKNTKETNNILLKILENLIDTVRTNSDSPMILNNEMMSLFKGI